MCSLKKVRKRACVIFTTFYFIFAEENLLLCLTDTVLSTYNINGVNFPLVKTFEQTKGASLFALDNTVSVSLP